jgi:2Fe-2S ferredoxin
MTSIIFIYPDGREEIIDVATNTTIMHAAVAAGIGGIVGECGGSAMCATCHVYVPADQSDLLPPVSAVEDAMLDSTASERRKESRLSCQLHVTEAFDGLVIHLPEKQI